MSETLDSARANKLKARASYVGAGVNVFQTLIKIGFGFLVQSAALIAVSYTHLTLPTNREV